MLLRENRDCSCNSMNDNMNNNNMNMNEYQSQERRIDCDEKEEMLQNIRCLEFAITELGLYLDTHPDDKKAICLHKEYANQLKDIKVDDKEFDRIEAIICSMTEKERRDPRLLNASRRKRIASGSGTSVQQINKFMNSFETTQKMMKKLKSGKGMKNMMKNLNLNDLKNFKP